ncbi:indole-3-glycerol phosphate synthase [Candidatus Hakubella thermalkaliphila]|uniref:Indole-3-glycerol phosphate synthase n=1 Tax=Candidatus Hakubella thermalkaliphila TaxID=2754717 RepID=A0A6V8PUX4_9ACTN|nr:indole-3-glycerol phosphate synthase TrpC [Candidatus Hakubella thermalkaliphila]GFP35694.1 indole-3-glycerol phosphate synthase [Candidatus Hakubella thermalkaliphila]
MNILDEIVAHKKKDLEERKATLPLAELEKRMPPLSERRSFSRSFSRSLKKDGLAIIGEIKKASPSRGIIVPDFDPVDLALEYEEAGVVAISVLTEERYFLGSLGDLLMVRWATSKPLLRKDFLFDEYQLYEDRAYGADAILLIVAILEERKLISLLEKTQVLGLDALVEVHSRGEVEQALSCGATIIGINNRDLKTFQVDLKTTAELSQFVPQDKILVSESGINNAEDVRFMREYGVKAILVGESLLRSGDITGKVKELLGG